MIKKRPPPAASPLALIKQIDDDPHVRSLIAKNLPPNYDFEIGKTVWRIRKTPNCKTVALQFPEGLLIFSTKLGDILRELTGVDVILMGDITYGACCIDDFTASLLGADLLVHYGHSCLVPTLVASRIPTIYVFVTINFNMEVAAKAIGTLVENRASGKEEQPRRGQIAVEASPLRVALVSTIQFANSLGPLKEMLEGISSTTSSPQPSSSPTARPIQVTIPRSKPLSSGEILGCTAPKLPVDLIVYVGDGRFHLEAMMMANPGVDAFRYDPYNSTVTHETFDHASLAHSRSTSISQIQDSTKSYKVGVILGTLGRQGNPKPMEHVFERLESTGVYSPFVILMSEVMPAKLNLFRDVDAWVQFACPRLSIDWGNAFTKPILTAYEATWLVEGCCGGGGECGRKYEGHPMDYYAYDSGGPHTPNFVAAK